MSKNTPPIVLAAITALLFATPVVAEAPGVLGGKVTSERDSPLAAATVYVFHLADSRLSKVATDLQGHFGFPALPAGLYKVVAFKPGFVPAVVMLTRATGAMRQFVDLELASEPPVESGGKDFWSLRGQIPPDVLREITTAVAAAELATPSPLAVKSGPFHAEMNAMAGVDTVQGRAAQVTGGSVGIRGEVGSYEIGLTGNYRQIDRPTMLASGNAGESRLLSLRLENADSTAVGLSGFSNRLALGDGEQVDPIDFERYQVSWSQRLGAAGHSHFAAQYVAESNYYSQSWIDLVGLPTASQTWNLEGSYSVSPSERHTIETGLRYRLRESEVNEAMPRLLLGDVLPEENLDFFARGGLRLQPAVLLEYGLYSTLADGTLTFKPEGGIVLQLGDEWQAGGSAARRVYDESSASRHDFVPAFFADTFGDEQPERAAYRVFVARQDKEDDSSFELSAGRREMAETLRLFFSDDVLNHLESLYLVPGDALHEAKVRFSRRLAPQVLTTLESTLADGGGGYFMARKAPPFENRVRYLVTSVDTQFQRTSTGVFVAFHRLEQQLRSTAAPGQGPRTASPEARFERFQILLTQDLDVLADLAADWAVQLDLELSRGALPTSSELSEDALRKQVMGGFTVSF